MKYVLGTAQFGLNYGISNNTGKVSSTNIEKIFRTAIDQGVNYLDTANVYGDAEDKIGTFFELTKQFKLITKTAHTKEDYKICLLYTSPSPRDRQKSRMPSSA